MITIHHPLTADVVRELAAILDAADRGVPVTWEASSGRLVTAVARGITDHQGNRWTGDIRDGYLWMSGTWEHFVPVREIRDMVRTGTMALDYRA